MFKIPNLMIDIIQGQTDNDGQNDYDVGSEGGGDRSNGGSDKGDDGDLDNQRSSD